MNCCCWAQEPDEAPTEPSFIGLSSTLKAGTVTIEADTKVCGEGSALGDAPILQDKGYFEARVVSAGRFAVGVATKGSPLDGVLEKAATAWTITSDHANAPAVGEVVGVAVDQADYPVQVYFYSGGKLIHQLSGVRGEVLPAFSVSDGASLDVNFGSREPWAQPMPPGFEGIIKSISLL